MKNKIISDKRNDEIIIGKNSIDFDTLFDFSKLLNSSYDLQFILDHILLSSMGKMLLTKGCIMLKEGDNTFSIEAFKGIPAELLKTKSEINNLPEDIFSLKELDGRKYKWVKKLIDSNLKIGIPVRSKDKNLAIIFFGEKLTKHNFNAQDFHFLNVLSNISSTSIENSLIVEELRKLNKDLSRKIQELNTLFDLSKEFGILFEDDKIVRLLAFSIMGQMGIQKYAILMKEENNLKIANSRINELEKMSDKFPGLLKITHAGVINSFKSRSLTDCLNNLKLFNVKAIIPLQSKQETKGVILLGDKLSKENYTPADIEFINSLGNLAMLSMENARLFRETLEKQKLEEEILIAREIQQGLLPKKIPKIDRFDIYAFNIPSKQVGGDYFDILQKSEKEYIIAIADVSGKGIPASLLMSNLQATIHAYAPMLYSLSEATGKINDIIYANTDMSKFITFFWGILNLNENSFSYINAGHNQPILVRKDNKIEYLKEGGVILGVMETLIPYVEGKIYLNDGDLLFLYTDGVSESMNSKHEEFGESKILEKILQNKHNPSELIIKDIYNDLVQHSSGVPQYDDITMIAVKMNK